VVWQDEVPRRGHGDPLRRSPSGRVPQWVRDEAAGRSLPDTRWRAASAPSTPTVSPLPSRPVAHGRAWALGLAIAVTAVGAGLSTTVDLPWTVTRGTATTAAVQGWPPPGHEEAGHRLLARPAVAGAGPHRFVAVQPDGVSPVTYSPCRPIHYVVRPDNAPAQSNQLISAAMTDLQVATGLTFAPDGTTTESPAQDRNPYQSQRYGRRWAPVLITWATAKEVPDFGVDIVGEAGSQRMQRPNGQSTFVTGQVTLDPNKIQRMIDTAGPDQAQAVISHELGHLVGLAHTDDPGQLMFPRVQGQVTDYQPGDLQGLARLGGGPCVPDL
jgi:hypothetical protein